MASYDNEMKGVLFEEEDVRSDKHPTKRGHCEIEGVKYWISSWDNRARSGKDYQSLTFDKAEEKYQPGAPKEPFVPAHKRHADAEAKKGNTPDGAFDDDIPF